MMVRLDALRVARLASVLRAFGSARGDWLAAEALLRGRGQGFAADVCAKAAVSAVGTTTEPELIDYGNDFRDALRDASVLGKMPEVNRLPFATRLLTATSGAAGGFVAQGAPAPVTRLAAEVTATLTRYKVCGVSAVSAELLTVGAMTDQALVRSIVAGCAEATDRALVDPSFAGSASQPPSLTHDAASTAQPRTVTGVTDAVQHCIGVLSMAKCVGAPVWIASPTLLGWMSVARLNDGAPAFPTVGMLGGTLAGLPIIASTACMGTSSPLDDLLVLVDQRQIDIAADTPEVDIARHASLVLDDAPGSAEQPLTSLWQAGLVGFKVQQDIDYRRRRAGAVAYAVIG